ncbi:hypothetical protein NKH03_34705, partial [Mesorhizobium sp. M1406]
KSRVSPQRDSRPGQLSLHQSADNFTVPAWLWLRHQPDSALAQWFRGRVEHNGGRMKKTTIVALARKLLVALWKYVTSGVIIDGAIIKAP